MTKIINAAIWLYGIFSIGLGAKAYFAPEEGHQPHIVSLIAGTILGLLMIGSYFLWTKNPRAGRIMSLVLGLLAMGNFGPKTFQGVMYPAGVMFFSSLVLVLLLGSGHMAAKKNKGTEA